MRSAAAFTPIILAFLAIGGAQIASAGEFVAYEGKDAIREGDGGAKKTVDGIDFWSDGSPPRRFILLGFISDSRHKTGLVGMARMAGLESSIAKETKKAGGDAVILMESHAETVGSVSQNQGHGQATATQTGKQTTGYGNWQGSSTSAAVQKQKSRYAVVKYLPEEDEVPSDEVEPDAP